MEEDTDRTLNHNILIPPFHWLQSWTACRGYLWQPASFSICVRSVHKMQGSSLTPLWLKQLQEGWIPHWIQRPEISIGLEKWKDALQLSRMQCYIRHLVNKKSTAYGQDGEALPYLITAHVKQTQRLQLTSSWIWIVCVAWLPRRLIQSWATLREV